MVLSETFDMGEYCGRPLAHPDERYLVVQQIEHRNTKVHSPQTNGFCERFHRTLKEEFVSVALRKKIYGSLQELQEALDRATTGTVRRSSTKNTSRYATQFPDP